MRRFFLLLVIGSLALPACGEHRVRLQAPLDAGRRLGYRLQLDATVARTLEGATREQRIEASFRAGQEILESLPDGGARARMTLEPVSLRVDGHPQEVGRGQEFVVTLGPTGQILELESTEGAAAEPLELVGLERLLPRLQPVLPARPVSPGDRWTSESDVADAEGRFSLSASSELERLGVLAGRSAALVRTIYRSPVDRSETLANATAALVGADVGTQEAWFSLDGSLLRSEGDAVGRYRITFTAPGGELGIRPVAGRLRVELHTEMVLVA